MAIMLLLYPYLFHALKAVENTVMYKTIPVNRITEGDWIVDKAVRKRFHIPQWGIEKSQIDQLKKSHIKNIKIKEGIPFVPSFLLAVIVVLNVDKILLLF